jgi:hypothetical protein
MRNNNYITQAIKSIPIIIFLSQIISKSVSKVTKINTKIIIKKVKSFKKYFVSLCRFNSFSQADNQDLQGCKIYPTAAHTHSNALLTFSLYTHFYREMEQKYQ